MARMFLALNLLKQAERQEVIEQNRSRRLNRSVKDPLKHLPDNEFLNRYRLTKSVLMDLCKDLRIGTSLRDTGVYLERKVLTAISFYVSGSYQRVLGENAHMSQKMVSKCVREVTRALNSTYMTAKWIKFPLTTQERDVAKEGFYSKYDFPDVVGCVDCMHVRIVRPTTEEHCFYNSKGQHSLNIQMICDIKTTILNVNAKFGGNSEDGYIWEASLANSYLKNLHSNGENVWLLGDVAYPQRSWLMTPIPHAANSREAEYNKTHNAAWKCIERCFGLLKARFRCLLHIKGLSYDPDVAGEIVIACCVLHNIIIANDITPEFEPAESEAQGEVSQYVEGAESINELLQGRATRNRLIAQL